MASESKNTYLNLVKNKADKLNTVRFDHENEDETVTLSYYDGTEWKELSNLGSGGGGGGSLGKGSLTSTFNKTVVNSDEEVTIDYFYSSPNGNGVLYVLVNNQQVKKENIGQGEGSVELGVLNKGVNTVRMYVIDKAGTYTDALTWTISCGTLEITCGFNADRDYYPESNIVFQFNVECVNDEPITFHITQNEREVVAPYTVQKGWNSITFPKYGPGIYRVKMWCQTVSYISNVVTFVVYILAGDSIFMSTTYDKESVPEGEIIKFDYRVSMKNQEYFDCKYYIDEELRKTGRVRSGTDYWNISGLTLGQHTIRIEAVTVDLAFSTFLEYEILVTESEFALVRPVTSLIKAWFDPSTKSNSDSDKNIWKSKYADNDGNYATAKLYGFNYSSNGWMGDYLKCDGNSYVEIDVTPFKNNIENGGLTIDIAFKTADVGNQDARVLDCTDVTTVAGCYIDTQNAHFDTKGGTSLKSAFSEDTLTHITFVVDRDSTYISKENDPAKNGKLCNNPMVQIYVNAIFSEIGLLSDSRSGSTIYYENMDHQQKIYINSRKGIDCFGSCEIYQLRIYERALTHEEILQNFISDVKDPKEQRDLYQKNYEDVMPTMRITTYGSMNPQYSFDKMTKDYSIPVAISFQAVEKYGGSSFELDYCTMKWQGTSTLQYAVKNYKFKFYENGSVPIIGDTFDDTGKIKYKYKMFGEEESIGEHTFTIKADYMDSSMANNTGNASFIGDCLYDTPIPPQMDRPKVRSCCKGYPIQLYIDGEYKGVYNFMLDKNQDDAFGFDIDKDDKYPNWQEKYPCVIAYEGSANSDNTAGAFNAWNSSRGVDLNTWYASDWELRYPEGEHDSYEEIHRLIDFVDNSTDSEFKADFDKYINREYCFRYYLFAYTMGCVDSLGKNLMLSTWDGEIWYFTWYDIDTCLGLDNSGYLKFESDIEMEAGVFNTSASRLWTRLRTLFKDELAEEYIKMRSKNFTFEKYFEYFFGQQVDSIGQRQYNLNIYAKYIPYYQQYSHMLHGSRLEHMKRWLKERFIYLDSYFGYESPEISSSITIRVNKSVGAVTPMSITLRTYSPQYVKILWRNALDAYGKPIYLQTKRIGRNQAVTFTMDMPDVTDQEVRIFNAPQLKDIGDITSLRPSVLLLSNATKITSLTCNDSELLKKVELSSNKMIQHVDLKNCSGLGTDQSGTTLDVSNCSNLKTLNVFGTSLLAVNTSTNGGNIESIEYPYTIQSVKMIKQTNLKVLGIPYKISNLSHYNYTSNQYCNNLIEVHIEECPYLEKIGINKGINNGYDHKNMLPLSNVRQVTFKNSMESFEYLDFSNCKGLQSLTLSDMYYLKELKLNDLQYFRDIDVAYVFDTVKITNCPRLETLEMNSEQEYDGFKASCVFARGTTLDLSMCSGLKTVRSNFGIEGLEKILLPNTVETLVFEGDERRYSDIKSIYVNGTHDSDSFVGIDLQGLNLKDFCMESLVNVPRLLNLNLTAHKYPTAINMIRDNEIYPYIVPEGTINLNEYTGESLRGLYKGITRTNDGIFNVVIDDITELPTVKDCESLFYDSDLSEEQAKRLYEKLYNMENASKLFKNFTNLRSLTTFFSNIKDASEMFSGCTSLREASFSLNNVTENCKQMFYNCEQLISCPPAITDSVLSCEQMFYLCRSLETGPRIMGENVTTCRQMFSECNSLKFAIDDIPSSCTSCQQMFMNCYELLEAPASLGGETSKVTSCQKMFYECNNLPSAFDIIPDRVTTCQDMFYNCKKLVTGPTRIGSSVTTCTNMFNGCVLMETVPEAIPDSVTSCVSMFDSCKSIQDAPAYLGTSITNMNQAFRNSGIRSCPDLPNGVKLISACFSGCTNLINAPELGTTATSGQEVFKNCTSLRTTPSVIPASINMAVSMFEGCTSLVSTNFNTIPGTINNEQGDGVKYMFQNCTSLQLGPSIIEAGVLNTAYMFNGCTSLTSTPTFIGDTVLDASWMFGGCTKLTSVGFRMPTTLKTMNNMFRDCTSLVTGPVSLPVAAEECSSMFNGCTSLTATVDFAVGTSNLTDCSNMYTGCTSITSSKRIPDSVTNVSAMFNKCSNLKVLANNGIRATTCSNFLGGCTQLTTINELDFSYFQTIPNTFFGPSGGDCIRLKDITFIGTVRADLNLGFSDNLSTSPTLSTLVNALEQRTAATPLKLTLSERAQGNLTTSQRSTITSKYWTISTY